MRHELRQGTTGRGVYDDGKPYQRKGRVRLRSPAAAAIVTTATEAL